MENESARVLKDIATEMEKISAGNSPLDKDSSIASFFKLLNGIAWRADELKIRAIIMDVAKGLQNNLSPESIRSTRQNDAILRKRADIAAEKAFWDRQAATTLTVGNGTGVVGIGAFLANSHPLSVAAHLVWWPFLCFFVGSIFSAVTPFARGRAAHFRLEDLEAQLTSNSEHYKGRAAAEKDTAVATWAGIEAGTTYTSLSGFVLGAISIVTIIIQQA